MIKTREAYLDRMYALRNNVYVGGEAANRSDHRLAPGLNVMATTFDMAGEAEYKGVATARSTLTGDEINRFVHLPHSTPTT